MKRARRWEGASSDHGEDDSFSEEPAVAVSSGASPAKPRRNLHKPADAGGDVDFMDDEGVGGVEEEHVVVEGREILAQFIMAEMEKEGMNDMEIRMAIARGALRQQGNRANWSHNHFPHLASRSGGSTMQQKQIVDALTRIGDALEADRDLNRMIERVTPEASWETFRNVAATLFRDEINWGRIVALFYFACKMVRRNLDRTPMIGHILDWGAKLIKVYLAHWIISRGGWRGVMEWFGPAWSQVGMAFGVFCAVCVVWRSRA